MCILNGMEDDGLPPLYSRWIAQLLGTRLLSEPRATCSDCVMCRRMEPETPSDSRFQPGLKCCTYMPELPNYLVGAILLDDSLEFAAGRAQFERKALRATITPLGVTPPDVYHLLYKMRTFGKSEVLLCPYYRDERGGECSIWKYRTARCATWFCKFERGRTGFELWQAVDHLLTAIEHSLAMRFAWRLGARPDRDASSQEAWGDWAGRARDFYSECFRQVQVLDWETVLTFAGEPAQSYARKAHRALRILNEVQLPQWVKKGTYQSEPLPGGGMRIWAYSKHDPVDISREAAETLEVVEREPVSETGLDPALVLKLLDMHVLIPVAGNHHVAGGP